MIEVLDPIYIATQFLTDVWLVRDWDFAWYMLIMSRASKSGMTQYIMSNQHGPIRYRSNNDMHEHGPTY